MNIRDAVVGLIVGAALSAAAAVGISGTSTSSPSGPTPPSAPALESGQAVKYFCKPDIREAIDQSPPNSILDGTLKGTTVLHSCYAPDGTIIRLTGAGVFINATDGKGLPLAESDIKGYLR